MFGIFKKGHFLRCFTQKCLEITQKCIKITLLLAKRALILQRAASDYQTLISSGVFLGLLMVKQFSPKKHPFSKFNCVSFIIFLVQSHENVCVWYLRLYLPIPISFCNMWLFLGPARAFLTILLKWAHVPFYHFSHAAFCWFNKSIFDPVLGHTVLQHIS